MKETWHQIDENQNARAKLSPWSVSAASYELVAQISPHSAHIQRWLRKHCEHWFWSYKSIWGSRKIHKYRIHNNEDWLHLWSRTASAIGYERILTILKKSKGISSKPLIFSSLNLTTEQSFSLQGNPFTKHTKGAVITILWVLLCSRCVFLCSLILSIFGSSPAIFLLLISISIPLWSDRILCMISILSKLLRFVLWARMCSSLVNVSCELEKNIYPAVAEYSINVN